MAEMSDRWERAKAALAKALEARETPFRIANVVTAAWRHAIGDDAGAMYGLVEYGDVLWKLIEQVVEFERSKATALHAAIAHGSPEHRDWLKKAIDDHFAGRPVEASHG